MATTVWQYPPIPPQLYFNILLYKKTTPSVEGDVLECGSTPPIEVSLLDTHFHYSKS
ncbi:MAG: hypothetical protein UR22_C0009G0024 [Parcubacteria group bacterium GW2011_GWC2_32_10]|nr:MAG: hypothetical protein UR22_C0009G0024 [Parcubacteria group bacterium GW2011_GWC2_32_10]